MRIVSLICILIVCIQSALPCSDAGMGISKSPSERADIYSNLSDNSHQSDGCAPFCQCSCCATHLIQYPAMVYNIFIPEKVNDYVVYTSTDALQIPTEVWQPPQLTA
ncbi:DUF6660 family protein [Olivibacter sp. 47]|uniref:DUF6660 family protein n=1 Tax=Olivibacter sp. 47 TaxID=3056486 RepID=UPI00338DEA90